MFGGIPASRPAGDLSFEEPLRTPEVGEVRVLGLHGVELGEGVDDHLRQLPIRNRIAAAAEDVGHGVLDDDAVVALEKSVSDEIDAAVAFAEAGTDEPMSELTRFVMSERGGAS